MSPGPIVRRFLIIFAVVLILIIIPLGSTAFHIWHTKWRRGDANINSNVFKCTEDCVSVDHDLWTKVLKSCVSEGSMWGIRFAAVDYSKISEDEDVMEAFQLYVDYIQSIDLNAITKEDALPFAINAYNSFAVRMVVEHNIWNSITELTSLLRGPVWKQKAGQFTQVLDNGVEERVSVSLDNIEHQIIRGLLTDHKEPRVHSAINCASISCPDLRSEAYTAAKLEDQLNDQMTKWMNNTGKGLSLSIFEDKVKLSKIALWYAEDFKATGMAPVDYLSSFANPQIHNAILILKPTVEYFVYDWSLNSKFHGKP